MKGLADRFEQAGVVLPVRASETPGETGVILGADGRDFATIDVNNDLPDAQADAIATAVADAINLATLPGSFEAQLAKVRSGVGIVEKFDHPRLAPARTLGGVVGEII